MASQEVDIDAALLFVAVRSMFNRLIGEWYWEDDAMAIDPDVAGYAMRWGKR